MEDGISIADHQILSPNPYDWGSPFKPPHRARLGLTGSIGRMAPRWRPRSNTDSSIEVDLLVAHRLTNLTTEGCEVFLANAWVRSANIYVSDDRATWTLIGVRDIPRYVLVCKVIGHSIQRAVAIRWTPGKITVKDAGLGMFTAFCVLPLIGRNAWISLPNSNCVDLILFVETKWRNEMTNQKEITSGWDRYIGLFVSG